MDEKLKEDLIIAFIAGAITFTVAFMTTRYFNSESIRKWIKK